MLDTGSMACTLSDSVVIKLREHCVWDTVKEEETDVVIIGCGGKRVFPKSVLELKLDVYGCDVFVPCLVVPGQSDDLILGTNVIKHLVHRLKGSERYWELISTPSGPNSEGDEFLSMLAGIHRWGGETVPDVIGTVKLNHAVTLSPGTEHLVWGKLPAKSCGRPGSTVMVEPSRLHSASRKVLVGRVVSPLWGDGWIPLKLINPSDKPVTLRRNTKVADVYPCIALEDVCETGPESTLRSSVQRSATEPDTSDTLSNRLQKCGLETVDLETCEVSDFWKAKLCDLVLEYESIFSRHSLDCGEVKDFVHRIRLFDERPFRLPFRRVPPSQYQKLRVALNEMEERGIIRKSVSEFASPLVLCWKKNGDLRICTDFRWLNARTVKDAHPLPHQEDCLAALGGNSLFSTMDLTSGFYNVPLHEDDKKYTAFTTPVGLHEYNRLPQGLCNSPASFMRMMTRIFGEQNFLSLLCYLDDLMVFAPNEEVALQRLEMVFGLLKQHNLKLSPKKCHFLRRSVKFLGHLITEDGVSTDSGKVEAIAKITSAELMCPDGVTPSVKKIQSFLGLIMWYQRFIENCSSLARPLFALTSGVKQARGVRRKGAPMSRKLTPDDWSPACEASLSALKEALIANVVLAHPDFSRPFILATDASSEGLGAVLSQLSPGENRARPIAFASKSLSRAQAKYPAHRLEFLALKWAVCDKFSHWLKGHRFTAWTDNNPLTHILTKPRLDACEQRWVAKLAAFEFDIKYVPGSKNTIADTLSRQPFVDSRVSHRIVREPYDKLMAESRNHTCAAVQDVFRLSNASQRVVGSAEVQAGVCDRMGLNSDADVSGSFSSAEVAAVFSNHLSWDEGMRVRTIPLVGFVQQVSDVGFDALPSYSHQDLRNRQLEDEHLQRVIFYVDRNRRPSRRERMGEPSAVRKFLKQWDKLSLVDGVLYRVSKDPLTRHKRFQYVVPSSLKIEVLRGCHDEAGHQGQYRTVHLSGQRFYWTGIGQDVREYVKRCSRCVLAKTPEPEGRALLESVKTSAPLELVCVDFWTAEDSQNKSVDVLVVTDHFTKLAHAFRCPDQSARSVAKKLWDNYFCYYGFPERIHSDQGANFCSELIRHLLEFSGVKKSQTTPYHPMGNGTAERFNRTLGNMIRALEPRPKHDWPQMLHTLTFLYNCTIHETTGFPPFYLMFGRTPRLPIDVIFKSVLRDDLNVSLPKYVESLNRDLKDALAVAEANAFKEQSHQARMYNRRNKGGHIEVGDRVLLANKSERGKRKLSDKWDSVVYTVVDRDPKTHIYRIKHPLSGQLKVVHRNLLLCVNFLPVCDIVGTNDDESVFSVDDGASDECSVTSDDSTPNGVDLVVADFVADNGLQMERSGDAPDSAEVVVVPLQSGVSVDPPSDHSVHQESLEMTNVCNSDLAVDGTVDGTELPGRRSRFGRLLKPVNRLISSMNQQTLLHTRKQTLGKWSISVLSLKHWVVQFIVLCQLLCGYGIAEMKCKRHFIWVMIRERWNAQHFSLLVLHVNSLYWS